MEICDDLGRVRHGSRKIHTESSNWFEDLLDIVVVMRLYRSHQRAPAADARSELSCDSYEKSETGFQVLDLSL